MQKILIVEDAKMNRELLREILETDYIVEAVENGEQALQVLQDQHDGIAALLLDLQMPKADGFTVIAKMRETGWMDRIPVLIISGEDSVEIENKCFELGVSDFIHKPFVDSIVKNRVRNTIELFNCKNQLEKQIEKQSETLKKQEQIIKIQAEQISTAEAFNKLMMEYRCAIMEVETRLNVLNAMFSEEYKRNPFESIKSRLKKPKSIYKKLVKKELPVTIENIKETIADVAGLRVICSFPDDIYRLAELLLKQDDIILLKEKDYIKTPKSNGYRSLHLILSVPVFLPNEKKYMKVEVQFRTIAMDFWASLEHKLKYKKDIDNMEEIEKQLKVCADSIEALDYQMQEIRDKIDASNH
ncbi:MAG: response regulator [Lachnospiraceae bacterium]|nr:response regulator [Lachnospiraceae bacterium]